MQEVFSFIFSRLTIAAVAATAALITTARVGNLFRPPHDCRSRGDCGDAEPDGVNVKVNRLTIAAVAATAAGDRERLLELRNAASRLPQSRRLRLRKKFDNAAAAKTASRLPQSRRLRQWLELQRKGAECPPHDCRSRGDCGCFGWLILLAHIPIRLTIAAVAATAAHRHLFSVRLA